LLRQRAEAAEAKLDECADACVVLGNSARRDRQALAEERGRFDALITALREWHDRCVDLARRAELRRLIAEHERPE
jgi:hypothetical protein